MPFITERVMPFAVLVGAMFCYLNLSRRLELVVARAAGISAWQFIAPAVGIAAVIGILTTTIYNPISASLREQSSRLEAELFGSESSFHTSSGGFWLRQRNDEGQAVINAKSDPQWSHTPATTRPAPASSKKGTVTKSRRNRRSATTMLDSSTRRSLRGPPSEANPNPTPPTSLRPAE